MKILLAIIGIILLLPIAITLVGTIVITLIGGYILLILQWCGWFIVLVLGVIALVKLIKYFIRKR